MKNKKALIIVIIMSILIILAAGGVFAFLYLKTDTFKSANQVFWTYFLQNEKILDVLSNENQEIQADFKENNTYISNGDLIISILGNNDTSQDINIKTLTKYDIETDRTYSEAILKNAENDLLKISYINSDDIYAIRCEDVLQHYIGIKNSNLTELIGNLGISESDELTNILSFINLDETTNKYELTEDEKKHIIDTYTNAILESIAQENYSKLEKSKIVVGGQNYNCDAYALNLDGNTVKQVIVHCLETMKNDQKILSILNRLIISEDSNNLESNDSNTLDLNINSTIDSEDNSISLEDYTNSIEQLIENLQETTIDNNISITIYKTDEKLLRTVLDIANIAKITVDMSITSSTQTVNITIEEDNLETQTEDSEEITGSTKINLTKITTATEITNTYEIIPDSNMLGQNIIITTSLGNVLNNTITNSVTTTVNDSEAKTVTTTYDKQIEAVTEMDEIMELKNSNTIIFNNYSKEQLIPFIESTVTKTGEVLGNKILQLGINLSDNTTTQDGNLPAESIANLSNEIIDIIKIIGTAGVSIINANGIDYTEILPSTIISMVPSIYMYSMAQDAIESTSGGLEEQFIQTHNNEYLPYRGEQAGVTVRTLCDKIKNFNLANEDSDEKISIQIGSAAQITTTPTTGTSSDEISQIKQEISAGKEYIIDFGYNSDGMIIAIGITEKE